MPIHHATIEMDRVGQSDTFAIAGIPVAQILAAMIEVLQRPAGQNHHVGGFEVYRDKDGCAVEATREQLWRLWSGGPLCPGGPEEELLGSARYKRPMPIEFHDLLGRLAAAEPSHLAMQILAVVANLIDRADMPAGDPLVFRLQAAADRDVMGELGPIVAMQARVRGALTAFAAENPGGTAQLVAHLEKTPGSKPSSKWIRELAEIVPAGRRGALANIIAALAEQAAFSRRFYDGRSPLYKGLVWSAAICEPSAAGPVLVRLALNTCFQSVRGQGMCNEVLGNACVAAFVNMPDGRGIPYLARVLARVKYPKTRKLIEAALNEAAVKAGITRGELDEISVPTHDLDGAGRRTMSVAGGAAHLAIDGTASVALTWQTPGAKATKSLPAALKDAKDDIKAIKAAVKEIEADLAVQPWRVQRLWLDDRRWAPDTWRQHYAEHPLMGALTRRLIWNVHIGDDRIAGVWQNALVGLDGQSIPCDGAQISLWHPIGCQVAEVTAWRERLGQLGIVQPFKQAHREVYIVTDAERRTGTYSNRFAGHIIRQHQMQALARLNGWSMTVHVGFDGRERKYPSRIALSHAGLVAEYWLEGVGGDSDYTHGGAHLYLATDQVRFVRPADMAKTSRALAKTCEVDGEAVRIEDVPPLVLSEIMRHCDLFVGVASIANDPDWVDAGADVAHAPWRAQAGAYWRAQSSGDIGATGETRRGLLTALLPSLAIGKVARIDGNFLRVDGKRRTYRIHLGCGNILMEPGNRYLCIVPKNEAAGAKNTVWLPFEGDTMLSIILSKAALLAADDKITDPTILSQLNG
jgi:hypothetical protein